MSPTPLFSTGSHVQNLLIEFVGNAFLMNEESNSLRVGEGRGRGVDCEFRHCSVLNGSCVRVEKRGEERKWSRVEEGKE